MYEVKRFRAKKESMAKSNFDTLCKKGIKNSKVGSYCGQIFGIRT